MDVISESAQIVFEAVKNENPSYFYYNQIGNTNLIPATSIRSSGFHLDGIARQAGTYPDNKLYDNMFWSKLKSEYNK